LSDGPITAATDSEEDRAVEHDTVPRQQTERDPEQGQVVDAADLSPDVHDLGWCRSSAMATVCGSPNGCAPAGAGVANTVAVGLSAVLAAKRLGGEAIVLMGRHKARTDLGREFGATDVVPERGAEGIERVRELTGGDGTHAVLECVGSKPALDMALGVVRDGGAISRVGLPQYTQGPLGPDLVLRNITITGGAAPARAYIEELLPDVLEGRIEPGRVFARTVSLDQVPDGYRTMADREALKVLIQP
jgi:threonine dehydrogenase-like Zn-dependent dehydrogenase